MNNERYFAKSVYKFGVAYSLAFAVSLLIPYCYFLYRMPNLAQPDKRFFSILFFICGIIGTACWGAKLGPRVVSTRNLPIFEICFISGTITLLSLATMFISGGIITGAIGAAEELLRGEVMGALKSLIAVPFMLLTLLLASVTIGIPVLVGVALWMLPFFIGTSFILRAIVKY